MDINQKLDWKQIVIAIFVLYAFSYFFKPIQFYVLSHPIVGVLILVVLIGGWFMYSKSKRKSGAA